MAAVNQIWEQPSPQYNVLDALPPSPVKGRCDSETSFAAPVAHRTSYSSSGEFNYIQQLDIRNNSSPRHGAGRKMSTDSYSSAAYRSESSGSMDDVMMEAPLSPRSPLSKDTRGPASPTHRLSATTIRSSLSSSSSTPRESRQWNVEMKKDGIQIVDNRLALTQSETWVEDNERVLCTRCSATFTFFNRRHHCRACGEVVCNDCSQHRELVSHVIRGLGGGVVGIHERICVRCKLKIDSWVKSLKLHAVGQVLAGPWGGEGAEGM